MSQRNDSAWAGAFSLLLSIIGWMVVSPWLDREWLDPAGMVSHQEESLITAQGNWFICESKPCSTSPLSFASAGKKAGYALSYVTCDDGPVHQVKIRFWGREEQPEYSLV